MPCACPDCPLCALGVPVGCPGESVRGGSLCAQESAQGWPTAPGREGAFSGWTKRLLGGGWDFGPPHGQLQTCVRAWPGRVLGRGRTGSGSALWNGSGCPASWGQRAGPVHRSSRTTLGLALCGGSDPGAAATAQPSGFCGPGRGQRVSRTPRPLLQGPVPVAAHWSSCRHPQALSSSRTGSLGLRPREGTVPTAGGRAPHRPCSASVRSPSLLPVRLCCPFPAGPSRFIERPFLELGSGFRQRTAVTRPPEGRRDRVGGRRAQRAPAHPCSVQGCHSSLLWAGGEGGPWSVTGPWGQTVWAQAPDLPHGP